MAGMVISHIRSLCVKNSRVLLLIWPDSDASEFLDPWNRAGEFLRSGNCL